MSMTMGDMSNPGSLVIKEDAFGFYIGGNTPWVWTPAQIDRQTARYRLPIWVYGKLGGANGGYAEGFQALMSLVSMKAQKGCFIALDMEVSVDVDYVHAFDDVLTYGGYHTTVYGSKDTVTKNPYLDYGYWTADYTGVEHDDPQSWAVQWQAAGKDGNPNPWDISVVSANGGALWNTDAAPLQEGIIVSLTTGGTRKVESANGGVSWR
jgi:hypothetical protein